MKWLFLFLSIGGQVVYVAVLENFASIDFVICPTSSYEKGILLIRENQPFCVQTMNSPQDILSLHSPTLISTQMATSVFYGIRIILPAALLQFPKKGRKLIQHCIITSAILVGVRACVIKLDSRLRKDFRFLEKDSMTIDKFQLREHVKRKSCMGLTRKNKNILETRKSLRKVTYSVILHCFLVYFLVLLKG